MLHNHYTPRVHRLLRSTCSTVHMHRIILLTLPSKVPQPTPPRRRPVQPSGALHGKRKKGKAYLADFGLTLRSYYTTPPTTYYSTYTPQPLALIHACIVSLHCHLPAAAASYPALALDAVRVPRRAMRMRLGAAGTFTPSRGSSLIRSKCLTSITLPCAHSKSKSPSVKSVSHTAPSHACRHIKSHS
jgi:hypothetical protein